MLIQRVEVNGFRCLRDVDVPFGRSTVLVGSNSAGKSSLLYALRFFFENVRLTPDDIFGRDEMGTASVQITFAELTEADRAVFGVYAAGEQMVLRKSWGPEGAKMTGRGLAFPAFDPIKEAQGRERTKLYRALRSDQPELELADATNMEAVDSAMLTWEMENPDLCELRDRDATPLFGYQSVAQSALAQRFKFVFVSGLQDAAEEATERRGSILERLLAAIADQRAAANERLADLENTTRTKYAELVEESHGPTLRELAERLEAHMRRYIPSADISLRPIAPRLQVAPPTIELRGGEQADVSDLSHQGHGFQRTFIISALEFLAETDVGAEEAAADRPTLLLAIEEPELYQHPPRARHFARTLRTLAAEGRSVQVVYATHSPYFVTPSEFENVRIFRRAAQGDGPAGVSVSHTTLEEVKQRPGVRANDVQRILARTMNIALAEGFFARAVLLVEGLTDAAAIWAAAEVLGTPLESEGIVVAVVSKSGLPTALAVLGELHIPAFTVFDGDAHKTGDALESAVVGNRRVLGALGAAVVDHPETQQSDHFVAFHEDLEHYLASAIDGFDEKVSATAREMAWKPKSPEVYAEVVAGLNPAQVPPALRHIIERVRALSSGDEESAA